MSRELSSLPRQYKSHKRSKNKLKRPYSKKAETSYSSQVWNIKEEGSMCSSQALFVKEADSPVHLVT